MARPRINADRVQTGAERARALRERIPAERIRHEEEQRARRLRLLDDDNFRSPAEAVAPLLEEYLPGPVWEPCAGEGYLARHLRAAAGYIVVATTLVDYGAEDVVAGIDFLKQSEPPPGVRTIISNAPYERRPHAYGARFIRYALQMPGIRFSAWLVPIAFMTGQCRSDLHLRVTRTITFAKRLPRMGQADYEGESISADDDFMWVIFDHANPGNGTAPNRYW